MVNVVSESGDAAVEGVDAPLGIPPAPAAWCTAGLGALPALEAPMGHIVAFRTFVRRTVAVHRQGVDAHVRAAHRLGFSLGRVDRRFPVGHGGVPAAVALPDSNFVWNAFRQCASHPDAAQVGQPDAAVAVVFDAVHTRGSEEGAGAGALLLVETRLAGLDLPVSPAGVGVAVVATRSLGHELAHLGCEGQGWIGVLGRLELLFQFMGREPQTGVSPSLAVGHQAVIDEAGDADAALGVAFLPAGEFQLDRHGGGQPVLGAGTGLLALLAL